MEKIRTSITLSNGTAVVIKPLLSKEDLRGLTGFREAISEENQYNFAPHNYSEETIRAYIERNKEGKDLIYLAWADGKVIAYFFLWEFDEPVPVLGIGVQDDYQGLGLGRKLMAVLLEDAAKAGKEGIALTVRPENKRAVHLYTSMGFYHSRDVENVIEGGKVEVFPELFLPLKEGAQPVIRKHAPPVL